MTNVIKLSKGLNLTLAGVAETRTTRTPIAPVYALQPDDFPGLKPKLVVKEGDVVKAGDALFVNKDYPNVNFVSPVSGVVKAVKRGERRKLLSVEVETQGNAIEYKAFTVPAVSTLTREQALQVLQEAGLWAFVKERPYDVVANPTASAKALFVSAFSTMPLAADFSYVVAEQYDDFQKGIEVLSKLAPVYLGISPEQASSALATTKHATVTVFEGKNPAGNVGVHINHLSPINKGEVVWTLGAEAVVFIGRFFRKGIVDLKRTIAVAGSEVSQPEYREVIVGAQLSTVLDNLLSTKEHLRIIDGNPLVGRKTCVEGFLGALTTEVTVIPEGDDVHEMFGWIAPRFHDFSTSRSYFTWLSKLFGCKKAYKLDARIKGGERHIIMSGEYDSVFPMDIYPEFLIKAIITGNIDRMEALGIYEVAPEDFAVAEFVDSSKLELQRIVREGLDMLRKEMA